LTVLQSKCLLGWFGLSNLPELVRGFCGGAHVGKLRIVGESLSPPLQEI
jgi:hypothetical protein